MMSSRLEKVNKLSATIVGWIIVAMGILITIMVITRYVFRNPLGGWVTEALQYALLFTIFLAAGYTTQIGAHVHVEMVLNRLSQKVRNILNKFSVALGFLYSALLIWLTARIEWQAIVGDWHSKSVVKIPLYLIYFIIPIGCLMMCIQFAIQFKEGRR